jgi:CRISPR-associated endonuclease/helicase Cas3
VKGLTLDHFETFFREATRSPGRPEGYGPHGYQARLARDGLPAVVQAPTGTGKTGVILAWLWRRLHGPDRDATPRRLIYALPQRSLVEQVAGQARGWLANLGLTDRVALHVVMGGEGSTQGQWRQDMHLPAIVVGTVDSLVSKALNRGYGIGRATYPIDFALVTNGAQWVIDEVQLCPESTTTLRQLAGFAAHFGTAEPFRLTCMSATIPRQLLDTVDNPAPGPGDVVLIETQERSGDLAVRLDAQRTVRRLAAEPGTYPQIAAQALKLHRPGTLTLVVMNTVAAARAVFTGLRGQDVPRVLLHSRFRGVERGELMTRVTAEPAAEGRIVVATQVVEAGLDVNATVLITEAAPWPCVVQRAGRCNRTGTVADAGLWWLAPAGPRPYEQSDVNATAAALIALEGRPVTSEDLLRQDVPVTSAGVAVLRRPDLVALFDTAPDLSGADIDVAPYIRDADELDAQLAWATWEPGATGGAPPDEAKAPAEQWRCRIPLGSLNELARKIHVWRLDQAREGWARVTRDAPARPGEVLVAAAADGGYDPVTGFAPDAPGPVPCCPSLDQALNPAQGTEDAYRDDSTSLRLGGPQPLDEHSEEVRAQASALLTVLRADLPQNARKAVTAAAYAHDAGKAHPVWQDALCALAPGEMAAGRPWAKSGTRGRLRFATGAVFRHELASLLLLDGPYRLLLADVTDADLARYLVLAHHGRLRLQVRDPGDVDPGKLLGLTHGTVTEIPSALGQPGAELTVDLDQFELGDERSWVRTALGLRDRLGPFVLAYLETVVRVADWRASAGDKVPR